MPINSPDSYSREITVYLRSQGGGTEISVSEDQLRDFKTDPDEFAAKQFGLSKEEYVEWIELHGQPLCGATTRKGKPCRSGLRGYHLSAGEWIKRHRADYCAAHQT